MATILHNEVDSPAIIINGYEDHIHALCQLSRKFSIANVVQEAKTETSKWMKKHSPATSHFTWQAGYGAFSVSESKIPEVKSYIANQVEHHRRMSYQDEFRKLCERHGDRIGRTVCGGLKSPLAVCPIGPPRWGFCILFVHFPRAAPLG